MLDWRRIKSGAIKVLRILFVCQENACASQMAEAFANMQGHEGVEAYSAGSMPASGIDEQVVATMHELGYDMASHRCKGLDDLPDVEFDYLVTVGGRVECPLTKARMQIDWEIPDPRGMAAREFRSVRDSIRSHVHRLLVAPRITLD